MNCVLLAEDDIAERIVLKPPIVSTHILLAEDDRGNHNQTDSPNNVSTHILLAEDDESIAAGVKPEVLFLPTSSSRRTT